MPSRSHDSESTFLEHIPCNECGSSDANSRYSDLHEFCHRCGAFVPGNNEAPQTVTRKKLPLDLISGEIQGLRLRKITDETCQKFNYQSGQYNGTDCQIANYHDADGVLVAQKIKMKVNGQKTFKVLGSLDTALPFGSQVWQKSGKKVVVTEGEIDALSMSQAQGNSWPVVSIACGAGAQVRKYIARHRDYFIGFDEVVIMFDNDAPGKEAAEIAASIIGRKARIASLPLKDANEMLVAGRVKELIDAMWKAEPYRPEGIVELSSLKEAVKTKPQVGLSYPWQALTDLFYGIRLGQLIGLGAGVGSGKTDVFTQIIAHLATIHNEACGVFYLETPPTETARRLAGKFAGKPFHVPDGPWTDADLDTAWTALSNSGKVFLYDSFGNNEWSPIREKIEYLYHAEGVQFFFIDHLTALAAWQDDERKALEVIMSEMGGLVKSLPITIFFVSHLATPEGKPHEEGGRIYARHYKGSRAIIQWATDLFALERDQQAEDETVRTTTTVRCLKERLTGRGLGKLFYLGYDTETGLLNETTDPESRQGSTHGFHDETKQAVPQGAVSDF